MANDDIITASTVAAEIRTVKPSAAKIIEEAADLIGDDSLTWELVATLAVIAASHRDELISVGASIEGLTTSMQTKVGR